MADNIAYHACMEVSDMMEDDALDCDDLWEEDDEEDQYFMSEEAQRKLNTYLPDGWDNYTDAGMV